RRPALGAAQHHPGARQPPHGDLLKVAARLQVGLFDVVERGRILAGHGDLFDLRRPRLEDADEQAAELADAGFDGVYTIEAAHDVFFPLLLAARGHRGIELSTSLAIAFPRSPMHVAHQSWDLQLVSQGRFRLGLGTQVRQVNERYYATPWSQPVERMRDYVLALRAIFACWQQGEPLRHDGPFYRLSFMNPPFNPGPSPHGPPPILLGALGPKMTRMTAEVADGLLLHPFVTERFVRERMMPAVLAGLDAAGRAEEDFEIVPMVMIATGRDETEMAVADAGVRGLIAFYGSTPTYRPLLELEGLGDLHAELFALSRQGRWPEMAALIDDDVLTRFAVRGEPKTLGPQIEACYGGLAERVN
ncbi:MAG: TIGR03617 family F420-dependent LLM class oxidoreductase, partial [Acidimicrobiia bacterium]